MSDKSAENLRRIRAWDAEWDESKHSRADNGQFTSGGGGSGSGSGSAEFIGTRSASKTGKVVKLTSGRKSRIAADLAENYYLGEYATFIALDEENKILSYYDGNGVKQELSYGA